MTEHLNAMKDELLAFFLCEYSPRSPKKRLANIVRETALRLYSPERVETFIAERLDSLRSDLVDEFNSRQAHGLPLRFDIVDAQAEGHVLMGAAAATTDVRVKFQNVLHRLSANDFEALAAVILKKLGCDFVYRTPLSHDQGVDAFGYKIISPILPKSVTHRLVWIAQAKHYTKHPVSTNAIREMVGTTELLLSKIFSTVEGRYKDMQLPPYAPTALLLMTTHAIPSTVRRLAERAGVYVFEASDLHEIIAKDIKTMRVDSLRRFIRDELKGVPTLQ